MADEFPTSEELEMVGIEVIEEDTSFTNVSPKDIQAKDNSVLKPEEQNTLRETLDMRMRMAKELFRGGPPVKSGDIRVANEVLTSIDKSIYDGANVRLKFADNKNNSDLLALAAATLKAVRDNKNLFEGPREGVIGLIPVLDASMLTVEVVPGELEINPTPLDINAFIPKAKGQS